MLNLSNFLRQHSTCMTLLLALLYSAHLDLSTNAALYLLKHLLCKLHILLNFHSKILLLSHCLHFLLVHLDLVCMQGKFFPFRFFSCCAIQSSSVRDCQETPQGMRAIHFLNSVSNPARWLTPLKARVTESPMSTLF